MGRAYPTVLIQERWAQASAPRRGPEEEDDGRGGVGARSRGSARRCVQMHGTTRGIGNLRETVAQVKSIAGAVGNAVVTDEAKISSCASAALSWLTPSHGKRYPKLRSLRWGVGWISGWHDTCLSQSSPLARLNIKQCDDYPLRRKSRLDRNKAYMCSAHASGATPPTWWCSGGWQIVVSPGFWFLQTSYSRS
jgi:hypothetical protein